MIVPVALCLAAAAGVALWRLPVLHPMQLWLVPWAAATSLNALDLLPYRAMTLAAAAVVLGGTAAFACGVFLAVRRSPADDDDPRPATRRVVSPSVVDAIERSARVAAGLTVLALVAFVADVARRYGLRSALVSSPVVRTAIGDGQLALTIKHICLPFGALALSFGAAGLARRQGRPRRAWLLLGSAMIATVYFGTGRATIVGAVVVGLTTYVVTGGRPPSRARFIGGIGLVGLSALLVLVGGGLIIGKTVANNPDVRSVPSFFQRHEAVQPVALAYHYAAAPIAALNTEIDRTRLFGRTDGCAMLPWVCQVLARAGAPVQPVPNVRPFTEQPFAWNTYTGLDAPLKDGGFAFFAVLVAALGAAVGRVWRAASDGSPRAAMTYGILAIPMVSSYSTYTFAAPYVLFAIAMVWVLPEVARRLPARLADRVRNG